MNSIINSGLSGMLHSQQSIQQSAHNIASTNTTNTNITNTNIASTQAKPGDMTNAAVPNNAVVANNSVNAPSDPSRVRDVVQSQSVEALAQTQNMSDPARDLINLQQQKQLFTASASVVEVGAEAVGSLIDDYS